MHKRLFSIVGASAIALTGAGVVMSNHPTVNAAAKSFDKTVKGQWTSRNGDKLKVDNSKVTFKIKSGSQKGTYKFSIKKHVADHYDLKADGKKLGHINDYKLKVVNGMVSFKYGNKDVQFNQGTVTDSDTSKNGKVQESQSTSNQTSTNTSSDTQHKSEQTSQSNSGHSVPKAPDDACAADYPLHSDTQINDMFVPAANGNGYVNGWETDTAPGDLNNPY